MDASKVSSAIINLQKSTNDENITSAVELWKELILWCGSDATSCQNRRTSGRPHMCETCGKRFTLLENLHRHQMIHTNQRPFKCTHCSKSFRLSQHLKEHIRIHTGEKPYKCHICGHAFCQISNLKSHQKTHTKIKGFRCDECGKEFRRSFTLKQHKLTHARSARFNARAPLAPPIGGNTTTPGGNQNPEETSTSKQMKSNKSQKRRRKTYLSTNRVSPQSGPAHASPGNMVSAGTQRNSREDASDKIPSCGSFPPPLIPMWNSIYRNLRDTSVPQVYGHTHPNREITPSFFRNGNIEPFHRVSQIPDVLDRAKSQFSQQNFPTTLFERSISNPSLANKHPCPSTEAYTDDSRSIVPAVKRKSSDKGTDNCKQSRSTSDVSDRTNNVGLFGDKSNSPSQVADYKWKRQLCKEWREPSPEHHLAVASQHAHQAFSHSPVRKLTSESSSPNKPSFSSTSPTFNRKESRGSSSHEDDEVFSPVSLTSSLSVASTEANLNNSIESEFTTSKSTPVKRANAETDPVFQYPSVDVTKQPRRLPDNGLESSPEKYTSGRGDRFSSSESPAKQRKTEDNQLSLQAWKQDGNSAFATHLQHKIHPNGIYADHQSRVRPSLEQNMKNNIPEHMSLLNGSAGGPASMLMTNQAAFPRLSFNVAYSHADPGSRMPFVPLIEWKPIVTGWRNVLDGRVYPAASRAQISPHSTAV